MGRIANKERLITIGAWASTLATLIVWFPQIAVLGTMLKEKILPIKAHSMAIGIIGGADGPTAIYVTDTTSRGSIVHLILLFGMLITTITLWYIKVKHKKQDRSK